MLKFIIGFQRRRGMTREECHRHLREVHGPLVASEPTFTRHVRGYVQNYALAERPEWTHPQFVADGAAELWFDDAETFVTAYAEPLYLERIRPDEANFTDPTRYLATFAKERTVWDGPGSGSLKLIRFLAMRGGPRIESKQDAWLDDHARVLAGNVDTRSRAIRYVQNRSIPSSENPFPLAEPFAGVDELWFEDADAAAGFLREEQRASERRPAVGPGIDLQASISLLVREGIMPGYGHPVG
jgi:uncharacterized protein (TIGR02118 family)